MKKFICLSILVSICASFCEIVHASQVLVPVVIGDTQGSNWQGWEMDIDGVSVVKSDPHTVAVSAVWLTRGTEHKITIHCTTTDDVTKMDYYAYVGGQLWNALLLIAPYWHLNDTNGILGNHYVEGNNSFNPAGYIACLTIDVSSNAVGQNGDKQPVTIEPISILNGNLTFSQNDVWVPCPGMPLKFTRSYNSLNQANDWLGSGWSHNYDWSLIQTNYITGDSTNYTSTACIILKTGEGATYNFMGLGDGTYGSPFENNWRLNSFPNRYELVLPGGLIYSFDTNGVLNTISNLWDNNITLTYTNTSARSVITKAQHSNGKKLDFTYDTNGLLTRVDTPLTNLWLSLSYDPMNSLSNVTQKTPAGDFVNTYSCGTNYVITQRVNCVGDVFSYDHLTNGWGSPQCTNLYVGSNYFAQSLQYDFDTNQYQATNRTVLTYQTRGTNQVYEYYYLLDTMRVQEMYGPDTTTGTMTRGAHYQNDTDGNITNETTYDGPESNIVARLYDGNHNLTSIGVGYCAEPSNFWTWTWDTTYNVPTSVTDPDNCKRGMEYTKGYISKFKVYYDSTGTYDTVLAYTTNGLLSAITNANGHWIQYLYNNSGYMTSSIPQNGPQTMFDYDVMGKLTKITTPSEELDGNIPPGIKMQDTILARDPLGRVTNVTYPTGPGETFAYDGVNNMTNRVDTGGRSTRYTYLPDHNISSVIRHLSTGAELTNSIGYDNQFNTLTITDAKGRAVETYSMDIADRVTNVVNVESQTLSVVYGVGHHVKMFTRFDGGTVTNMFNGDGLLTSVKYPDTTNEFIWSNAGRPLFLSNEVATVSNSWQQSGWLASSRIATRSGPITMVTYSNYPAGNVSNITSIAGTRTFIYDEAERVSSISSAQIGLSTPLTFAYTYSSNNGFVSTMTCTNNGLEVDYSFDGLRRLTRLGWTTTNGASRTFNYSYNNANMITGITRENGEIYSYDYDDADRLTNAGCFSSTGTVISSEQFGYDEVGNRTSKTINGLPLSYSYPYGTNGNRLSSWLVTQTNLGATIYISGSANEAIGTDPRFGQLWVSNKICVTPLVSGTNFWVYDMQMNLGTQQLVAAIRDLAGNTTYKTNTVILNIFTNGSYSYNLAGCVTNIRYTGVVSTRNTGLTWDGKYKVSSISTNGVAAERNGFDALGRRAWSWDGTTTNYFVYERQHIIADVNATGGLVRSYVWGPGIDNLLAFTTYTGATAKTYFALTDHLRSVHALADDTGTIVESYRFDAWGRVLGVYDGNNNPLMQSALGNRYLWQGREYSWQSGFYFFRVRWYDPITGRWLSNDPISISGGLNQYAFCSDNPVNFRDPFGLCIHHSDETQNTIDTTSSALEDASLLQRVSLMFQYHGSNGDYDTLGPDTYWVPGRGSYDSTYYRNYLAGYDAYVAFGSLGGVIANTAGYVDNVIDLLTGLHDSMDWGHASINAGITDARLR
jgi:RHS repeat-associated protein